MTTIICMFLSFVVGVLITIVLGPTVVLSKLLDFLGKTLKWLRRKTEESRID